MKGKSIERDVQRLIRLKMKSLERKKLKNHQNLFSGRSTIKFKTRSTSREGMKNLENIRHASLFSIPSAEDKKKNWNYSRDTGSVASAVSMSTECSGAASAEELSLFSVSSAATSPEVISLEGGSCTSTKSSFSPDSSLTSTPSLLSAKTSSADFVRAERRKPTVFFVPLPAFFEG